MIRAERIDCALYDRVFPLPLNTTARTWRGVLLSAGSGIVHSDRAELVFSATGLLWTPWQPDQTLKIIAGSVGYHVALSADVLAGAIGHNAESSELRMLSDRRITCQLNPNDTALSDADHAFATITREAGASSPGAISMIEAQLRAVLVILWREAAEGGEVARGFGRSATALQHFRHLLETHFRERWQIGEYAAEIGISPDRLHDICTRHLNRTPRVLVQERVIHEARLMLENTTLSADQISARLGYRDVGHFSRFFKAKVGQPPATYRRLANAQAQVSSQQRQSGYVDWP